MIPIVFELSQVKPYYDTGYIGVIICKYKNKEKEVNSYEEAKIFYKEETK